MFCPHCATKNSDDVNYCRSCRENLKVITQAMKRHLPVVMASKVDDYIERKSEVFRRDSIMLLPIGTISLVISILVTPTALRQPIDSFLFLCIASYFSACYLLGGGIWSLFAYKRSLALHSKSAKLTTPPQTIYCPRCGRPNDADTKFCHACGADLRAVVQAINGAWPTALTRWLDSYIERKYKWLRRSSIVGIIMVVILSFLGFLTIRSENWNWITVWVIFSICLGLLYSALNILTYKRNLAAGAKSAGLTADSVTSEFPPHSVPQFMPLSGRSEAPTELLNPHPERPKERL